jgi:hypothetical protein
MREPYNAPSTCVTSLGNSDRPGILFCRKSCSFQGSRAGAPLIP